MHSLVLWVQAVLVPLLGPPGVFLVAFCDSSIISLPEINDLLVVSSASSHPGTAWIYVLMATGGSLAGCSALWWIGRRGGEAVLERRFGVGRVARVRAAFQRWDVLALAIPAVLPPPMPFKIFVVSAGVFGFSFRRFAITLVLARGARYACWALIGLLYGDEAMAVLRAVDGWFASRATMLLYSLFGMTLVFCLALLAMRRRRRADLL
jgi:membrane protein YqaA with SNARE-associated domain